MQLISLLLLGLSPSLVLGFPKFKWPSGSGGGGGNTVTYGSHGKDSKCKPSNPPNRKHNEHVAQCLHGDHAVSIDSCYKMLDTISNNDDWKIHGDKHEVLHAAGCGFSIKRTGTSIATVPLVNPADAKYLVNKTIEQCGSDGKVGGVGIMTCEGLASIDGKVVWRLEPWEPKD